MSAGTSFIIYCAGKGRRRSCSKRRRTAMSAAWAWVQADVAKTTRVCSYDRAGLGWSESGDAPFSPQACSDRAQCRCC